MLQYYAIFLRRQALAPCLHPFHGIVGIFCISHWRPHLIFPEICSTADHWPDLDPTSTAFWGRLGNLITCACCNPKCLKALSSRGKILKHGSIMTYDRMIESKHLNLHVCQLESRYPQGTPSATQRLLTARNGRIVWTALRAHLVGITQGFARLIRRCGKACMLSSKYGIKISIDIYIYIVIYMYIILYIYVYNIYICRAVPIKWSVGQRNHFDAQIFRVQWDCGCFAQRHLWPYVPWSSYIGSMVYGHPSQISNPEKKNYI
jgi:hypothetical protein